MAVDVVGRVATDDECGEGAAQETTLRIKTMLTEMERRICSDITQHQTEAFDFIYTWIRDIIMKSKPLRQVKKEYMYQLKASSVTFMPPTNNHEPLSPSIATQRQLTYCSSIMATFTLSTHRLTTRSRANAAGLAVVEVGSQCFEAVELWSTACEPTNVGVLPLMTQARGCLEREGLVNSDPDSNQHYGGNFIILGSCKVMSPSETLHTNYPLLLEDSGMYSHIVDFRASHHKRAHRATSNTSLKITRYNRKQPGATRRVMVSVPYVKDLIPLMVLFMALGWTGDEMIRGVRVCTGADFHPEFLDILENILYATSSCTSQRDALLLISRYARKPEQSGGSFAGAATSGPVSASDENSAISFAQHTLRNEVLPNMGQDASSNYTKGMQLCDLLWRLMMFSCPDPANPARGRMQATDRDDTRMRRYESPVVSIANLYCQLYRITLRKGDKTFRDCIQRGKPVEISKIINSRNTTPRMLNCIGTGLWSAKKTAKKERTGMSQAQ